MNDTVAYSNVCNWWNGRVIIDEIKMYTDSRGMVSEVWRIDSLMGVDSKQCYISETAPYVQRGSHEHSFQCDRFVSWKNHMVYQMFNPATGEMKTFTTQKDKIYRVHVDVGILHSYRNLDKDKSFTMNFPTSLFMGEGKKDKIDEIRHEVKYEHNDVIVIFGAGGKLGQAITTEFFAKMSEHKYDVVPSYEKLMNAEQVKEFFEKLDLALGKDRKVFFVNCAALTNVQNVNTEESIWEWSNVTMPVEFAKRCKERDWKVVQFSTDYIYQQVEKDVVSYSLSSYTRSKIRMESALKCLNLDNILLIRVSNLFASNDPHNVICKMKSALKNNGSISVDPRLHIFPSHVDDVAVKIHELYGLYKFSDTSIHKEINLVPDVGYNLAKFVELYFNVIPVLEKGKIQPWHQNFLSEKVQRFGSNIDRIKELL